MSNPIEVYQPKEELSLKILQACLSPNHANIFEFREQALGIALVLSEAANLPQGIHMFMLQDLTSGNSSAESFLSFTIFNSPVDTTVSFRRHDPDPEILTPRSNIIVIYDKDKPCFLNLSTPSARCEWDGREWEIPREDSYWFEERSRLFSSIELLAGKLK